MSLPRPRIVPRLAQWAVAAGVGLAAATSAFAGGGAPVNFWGSDSAAPAVNDETPVARSYFTTQVEPFPGGAKLIVDFYHGKLNTPVSVSLQVAINDGSGAAVGIPLEQLDKNKRDNPSSYHSRREYYLSLSDLNERLQKLLPPSAQHLKIEPGSALFVVADWKDYQHQWGGIGRGGIFFMPSDGSAGAAAISAAGRRPEELDLAYPIPPTMALAYNSVDSKGNSQGLKVGGQIRSRVESEGKYQIPLKETKRVKKMLFDIARDPSLAAQLLGPDWTVTAMMKYMKLKPGQGLIKPEHPEYLLDADGLPTPDPMVDTYYDNDKLDAAKNDIAIRYRWTEGNATGAWNLKPGLNKASPEGIVDRVEFGIDATDDKPETIRGFADSSDPLNPFSVIRRIVPGTKPSDFLKPSVKITDTRFKFEFKHKDGLVFEVSLDEVLAESLRGQAQSGRYVQLEADIDHLSTASANVASLSSMFKAPSALSSEHKQFLAALGPAALLDGRPAIHTVADLEPSSPVKQKHQADFALAGDAIVKLRTHLLGPDWIAGPQKYALAAETLDLVSKAEASGSVRKMIADEEAHKAAGAPGRRLARRFGSECAEAAFNP